MAERRLVASAVRFWEQVEKGPGPDDCWLWTGRRDVQGYGRLSFEGPWDYAHRVAWTLVNGEAECGIQLVSGCGNRACVRPAHRIPFTAAAAGRYKAEHGLVVRGERHPSHVHPERWARGERHGSAKLSDRQVAEIRARYAAGDAPVRQLAREYGVSISQIRRIVTGRNRAS